MAFPSPSQTPPTLSDWFVSYNGLTMGPTADGTSPYVITQIEGLDLPTIRSKDVGRPRDHGELIGLDVYGGRTFTVDLWMQTDGTSLQSAQKALAAATEDGLTTELPFWFKLPNLPTMAIMARVRRRTMALDLDYGAALVGKPVIQFHATDPRIYAAPTNSDTVSLGTPVSGFSFPITFPLSFGGGSTSTLSLDNSGNTEMRPILTFTGPVTNPAATNSSISGNPTLTFSNPTQTGYTVLSGDTLVVDLDLHTITYYTGGAGVGASRADWLVSGSTWWNLPTGTNLINFSSTDSTTVAGTLTADWASAYML